MQIVQMSDRDRSAVYALLRSHGLPLDGFDAPHVLALVAKKDDAVVGSAAIEVYGRYGLLRSVAVADELRGQSVGLELTRAAIARAREHGLGALYLLTETAAGFFPKFGFVPIRRVDVPAEVQASVEFTTACPAGAQVFQLSLTGVSQ